MAAALIEACPSVSSVTSRWRPRRRRRSPKYQEQLLDEASKHGATYGLCQIYRNEPWDYELRTNAIDHRCPPIYAEPTQDPRMQQ